MEANELIGKLHANKPQYRDKLMDIDARGWKALKESDRAKYDLLVDELEDLMYCIEPQEAESIVRTMKPFGQVWSRSEIESFVRDKGIDRRICDWYMVMNMARNDYYNTAKMVGKQDDAEFYYSIARDFIMDPDGAKHKVGKYFAK